MIDVLNKFEQMKVSGYRLKEIREKNNVSLRTAAETLYLDNWFFDGMEKGFYPFFHAQLEKLSELYGEDVTDLIDFTEDEKQIQRINQAEMANCVA